MNDRGITELILIRHGETSWNADRRLQGHLDIALNDVGVMQANLLAAAFLSDPPDIVISSDLQRACATARPLAQVAAVELIIDTTLRERCFGAFEGLRHNEIERHFPAAYVAWKAREPDARFPAGVHHSAMHIAETLHEFSQRAIASVLGHVQRHSGKKIAIVTHGGVLDCAYRYCTNMALQHKRNFSIANASVNRFVWQPEEKIQLRLLQWGDLAHLPARTLDEIEQ